MKLMLLKVTDLNDDFLPTKDEFCWWPAVLSPRHSQYSLRSCSKDGDLFIRKN